MTAPRSWPLLDQIRVPSIVVLHTVLANPTAHQREVLEAVAAKADAVVTMTAAARDRLAARYAVDMAKVCIIAHGAPAQPAAAPAVRSGHLTILTWGLLGPGQGHRVGHRGHGPAARPAAHAALRDRRPDAPEGALRQGEAYRDRLREQVRRAGLGPWVRFDGHYRDAGALAGLIDAADVVLLPYDSTDQVTSGVLIEAVAAGKPVVATQFPHARELLAGGAGLVVPHRDPAAIAAALRSVATRAEVRAAMAGAAAATAPGLLWPAIAGQYRELADRLITASVAA